MTIKSGFAPEETHFSINRRPDGSSTSKSHGFRESIFQLQISMLTGWEEQNSVSFSLIKASYANSEFLKSLKENILFTNPVFCEKSIPNSNFTGL